MIYVEELIALGTVNTMPEAVIHAYADHGETRADTITGAYDAARKVFADLESVGVDMSDVIATLEREGVEKFEASWQELLDGVSKSLKAAGTGTGARTRRPRATPRPPRRPVARERPNQHAAKRRTA